MRHSNVAVSQNNTSNKGNNQIILKVFLRRTFLVFKHMKINATEFTILFFYHIKSTLINLACVCVAFTPILFS